MPVQNSTNLYGPYKWIVNPTAGAGTHTTIQAAINAASSGDNIFVTPATYTETITLTSGVSLIGTDNGYDITNTIISGSVTLSSGNNNTSISNINISAPSTSTIIYSGTGTAFLELFNCLLNTAANNSCISYTNSNAASKIVLNNCKITTSSGTATPFTSSSAGEIRCFYCFLTSALATAATASAGTVSFYFCRNQFSLTTSGTAAFTSENDIWNPTNLTGVTIGGSGANTATESTFISGTASAISVGSTLTLTNCSVSSSNTNAITGAGTLTYGGVIFFGSSSTINTTNQTPIPWPVQQGGTAASSFTAYMPITGGTTTTGAFQSVATGSAGQVLTYVSSSALPTWQNGSSILTTTQVTNAASPYTVLATDEVILVNSTAGAVTIKLPNAPSTGRVIYIKDWKGQALTNAISITTVGGAVTIDGVTTYTQNITYQSTEVIFDGSNYSII